MPLIIALITDLGIYRVKVLISKFLVIPMGIYQGSLAFILLNGSPI